MQPLREAVVVLTLAVAASSSCRLKPPEAKLDGSGATARVPRDDVEPAGVQGHRAFDLIVAGDNGLYGQNLDGASVRLSKSVAAYPRRMSDGSIVFVSPRAHALELRRWRPGGDERLIARIPTSFTLDERTCTMSEAEPDAAEAITLALQEQGDFRIGEPTGRACLTLQDRNINMADFALEVIADLVAGTWTSRLALAASCDPPEHESDIDARCAGATVAPARPAERPSVAPERERQWSFRDGRLTAAAGGKAVVLCRAGEGGAAVCAEEEAASPSGRWLLLTIEHGESDYIYREPLLADLDRGRVLALADGGRRLVGGADPPACFHHSRCFTIVGESDLRWLHDRDVLVLDNLVIDPVRERVMVAAGSSIAP